jgi:hypothetical protein
VKTKIFKLFNKYEEKFGSARSQRRATQPASNTGKRKHAWRGIFGGPGASDVVGPSPASAPTPYLSASAAAYELSAYLEVTMSMHMRMNLIYFSGGVTIS